MTQPEGPWRDAPPPPKKGAGGGLLMWLAFLAAMGLGFLVLTRLFPGRGPGSDWPEGLRLFGVLAVVSSGLVFMRRIDVGQTARHLAGWAAIFAVAVAGYAYRGDVRAGLLQVRLALIPAYGVTDSPRSMIVGRRGGRLLCLRQGRRRAGQVPYRHRGQRDRAEPRRRAGRGPQPGEPGLFDAQRDGQRRRL